MPIGVDAGVAGQSSDVPPSWPGCPAAATRREKGQLGRLSTSRPSHLRCNLRASAMFEQASQARHPAAWLCRLTQPTQLLARPCVTASASEQLPPLERTSAFEATAGRLGTPAMGAEQSAPSGAERPLQRSYNGPTYGGVGRDTAVRGSRRNYGLPCSGVGSATGENQQSERRVDGGVLNRWRSTWDSEIVPMLLASPGLRPITALREMQRRHQHRLRFGQPLLTRLPTQPELQWSPPHCGHYARGSISDDPLTAQVVTSTSTSCSRIPRITDCVLDPVLLR